MKKQLLPAFSLARTTVTFPVLFSCLFGSSSLVAQVRISDNPASATAPITTINANSLLELESSSRALLLPRLTKDQIVGMDKAPAGMLAYNTSSNTLTIKTATGWLALTGSYNAISPVSPWVLYNNGAFDVAYNVPFRVGINTITPISELANTSANTIGSDGIGGNSRSHAWSVNQLNNSDNQAGYASQINNSGNLTNANGLLVKVNSLNATALDVSRGVQTGTATPLLTVKSSARVGIGLSNPSEALDVNGNINYSGILQMGVQYLFTDGAVGPNSNATVSTTCPVGTKLIGGGGGQRDSDSAQLNFFILYSGPDKDSNNSWRLTATNSDSSPVQVRVYAICARVQ